MFDGLHSGTAWAALLALIQRVIPPALDANGYIGGGVGLVGVWLAFYAAYLLTGYLTASLLRNNTASVASAATPFASTSQIARAYAPTLVPIAVAYNIAHNYTLLLTQSPTLWPLLSDPLGRQWNLFGSANSYASVTLIEPQTTWLVAITAIVLGHVLSVWLAHRVALRHTATPRATLLAALPLTVLMVAYTAVSLLVIAEPMVQFEVGPVQ